MAENATDRLLLTALPSGMRAAYLAGFGWDKDPNVPDSASWAKQVAAAAENLRQPVSVALSLADGQRTAPAP